MEVPSMEEFLNLKDEVEGLKKLVLQLHASKISVEWVRVDVATSILESSKTTLWRLTKNGEIGYEKRGHTIRYNLESIRQYLIKNRYDPAVVEARIKSLFSA